MTFRRDTGPSTFAPLYNVSCASIGAPLSVVLQRPVASKFSSERPIGSISRWQFAHTALARCSCIRSRIESTLPDSSFKGGTFGGGGGGGVPRIFVRTYLPRETGFVRSSFEVRVKMLAWPSRPLRYSSFTLTRRI